VFCTDLDEALAFYTQRLGFEVHDDVIMGLNPPALTERWR
jgi:catechol 2,3-dioxygenase-like lactoylglutathione lyase family enzyme